MKTKILVSTLFLTTAFTASTIAMEKEKAPETQKPPLKIESLEGEIKNPLTDQQMLDDMTKEFTKLSPEKKMSALRFVKEMNTIKIKPETEAEKAEELFKLPPKEQINKLDQLFDDFRAGVKKKPTYSQDKFSKYEVYISLAAQKLNEMAELDKLSPEEEEYFQFLVIFVNNYFDGIDFDNMPLVKLRALQLFPGHQYELNHWAFNEQANADAKNKYGVKKLILPEDEIAKLSTWKPAKNPPKSLKLSTD